MSSPIASVDLPATNATGFSWLKRNDPSAWSVEGGEGGRRYDEACGRPACTGQAQGERGFLKDNRQRQAAFGLLKSYGRRQAARSAGNTTAYRRAKVGQVPTIKFHDGISFRE